MNDVTPRQQEILELYDELGSATAVGDHLGISYNAVTRHLRGYRRMLGEQPEQQQPSTPDDEPDFTHVTPRQQEVKDLFDEMGSQSAVARHLGVSTVTVREKLIQYERNVLKDQGRKVLTLEEMQKGRISSFKGGRPSSIQLFGDLDNVHVLLPQEPEDFGPDNDIEEILDDQVVPTFSWRINIEPRVIEPPKRGIARGFMLSAQDATNLHEGLWANIEAYEAHLRDRSSFFERTVSGFTYGKSLFEDHSKQGAYFDARLEEYMVRNRLRLADAVDFCGEMNTLPTAVTPLSGFQAYTEHRWGIFPHAKQQLESVPRMKSAPYKANMTTGAVTLPNYIPKKAGLKAEFHHTLGFVVWEMLPDGRVWIRHVTADPATGDFRDLDVKVSGGRVTTGHRVEAIQFGDIHHEKLDPDVARHTWGYDLERGKLRKDWMRRSLVDRLRPRHQFMHDLSDFAPRNHHNVKDHHFLFATREQRTDDVEHELRRCARFLEATKRKGCRTIVVQSNHDNALTRWLKEADYRSDQVNALFFLETQTAYYRAIQDEGREPPVFERVLRGFSKNGLHGVKFIGEDHSYVIADGIECSQHGHLGANGSRGSGVGLSRISQRMNIGHGHSPMIRDGLWMAGVCSLEMGYNKGPSSWGIAHIVTHEDGARQLLFMIGDRFHA